MDGSGDGKPQPLSKMRRTQVMGDVIGHRAGHIFIILAAGTLLFLPNLGQHSFWDVDESHNAECAREMLEARNWIVPTFNFRLRTDKPALLYWCMMAAYQLFGVNEFAARLPSALASIGTLLLVYGLGRRMFDAATGLMAALTLGSSLMFCVSAHAATPDALLIFFTTATFWCFWRSETEGNSHWLVACGFTTGMAVLAKGLVGVVLPVAAISLFLLWERRLMRVLFRRQFVGAVLLFAAVALPWYLAVGYWTKWEFLHGFFGKHHWRRFQEPLEGHGGSILYHPLVLLATFAPWSAFIGLTLWHSTGARAWADQSPTGGRTSDDRLSAYRMLWCWFAVWLVFFSIAGTKLPNYMLPAFPPLAILSARFFVRWCRGQLPVSDKRFVVGLVFLVIVGVVVGFGLLLASGALSWLAVPGFRVPELLPWSLAGLIPALGATIAWLLMRRHLRAAATGAIAFASVAFVSVLAAYGPVVVDQYKIAPAVADAVCRAQLDRDIDIGCYGRYRPGLVFYTQRKMHLVGNDDDAKTFLRSPRQTFLLLSEKAWERIRHDLNHPVQIVDRRWDLLHRRGVILVTNRSTVAVRHAKGSHSQAATP